MTKLKTSENYIEVQQCDLDFEKELRAAYAINGPVVSLIAEFREQCASMPTVVTGEQPRDVGAVPGSHPADQAPSGLGAARFDPERIEVGCPYELTDDRTTVWLDGYQAALRWMREETQ